MMLWTDEKIDKVAAKVVEHSAPTSEWLCAEYMAQMRDEYEQRTKELETSNAMLLESCERVLALFLVIHECYDEIRLHGETKCATLKIADIVNDLSTAVAMKEPDDPR